MRILFDQGTPVPLRRFFAGHQVSTAYAEGWANFRNGDLLAVAEGHFDHFIITDKNLRYQQDLRGRTLAILHLPTTNWPEIQVHGIEVTEAAFRVTAGGTMEIHCSARSRATNLIVPAPTSGPVGTTCQQSRGLE